MFGHLLQNALDAIPAGGRVVVHIEPEERFNVIVVSDTGAGMTAEFIRDRLFKPFETTKESGMGIGMYESAQYVTSIGGAIDVDSVTGGGTQVRVRLPRADAPPAGDTAAVTEQVAQ